MATIANRKKSPFVHASNFGAATAIVCNPEGRASIEVSLAPLEVKRVLGAWQEHEKSKRKPDEVILNALEFLIKKARTDAPRIKAEVPMSSTGRVRLLPDFDKDGN